MRKLLIVSPRFPPKNAPDLHRVRLSLAHYRAQGWEPTVLCVEPATADGVDDPVLAQSLPPGVPIIRVRAWSERLCRRLGFGQLSYRSLLPLHLAGRRLLRRERHEIVFFSTTVFLCFVLGPLWKRRYGCRLVYDFQDPWYSEVPLYTRRTVPGRWWKHRLDQWLAKRCERFALRQADHVVAVSPAYVDDLCRRHRSLARGRFTVLPFGAAAADFEFVRARRIGQTAIAAGDGLVHWVYAGRAGPDMAPVLAALFDGLARLRRQEPEFANRLRLHFVGTNYAEATRSRPIVQPLADAAGVAEIVEEIPLRQPYHETLALYLASDAVLLIGSIHADYTASKLLTCVLAKKPILAMFHFDSLVARIAPQFSNVCFAGFARSPAEPGFAARIDAGMAWLRHPDFDAAAIDEQARPWSAEALTRVQCAIFDRAMALPAPPRRRGLPFRRAL